MLYEHIYTCPYLRSCYCATLAAHRSFLILVCSSLLLLCSRVGIMIRAH